MRLFVAVAVGDEVRLAATALRAAIEEQLRQLRSEAPRLVWAAADGLHVTLRFLGEVPDEQVSGVVEAVQEPFALAPFTLAWHGLGAFPSSRHPRAIWMGVGEGARELGQLEVEVTRRLGSLLPGERPEEARPFHPHLTLARVKTESRAVDWPAVLGTAVLQDVRSRVAHVSLLRSRGHAGGVGYEEIGRGRLDG